MRVEKIGDWRGVLVEQEKARGQEEGDDEMSQGYQEQERPYGYVYMKSHCIPPHIYFIVYFLINSKLYKNKSQIKIF